MRVCRKRVLHSSVIDANMYTGPVDGAARFFLAQPPERIDNVDNVHLPCGKRSIVPPTTNSQCQYRKGCCITVYWTEGFTPSQSALVLLTRIPPLIFGGFLSFALSTVWRTYVAAQAIPLLPRPRGMHTNLGALQYSLGKAAASIESFQRVRMNTFFSVWYKSSA